MGLNKFTPGCKCCGQTYPGCVCQPADTSPTWNIHWTYWAPTPDFTGQSEYPNDSFLTYSPTRPAITYTEVDYPGAPGYTGEWGPGWYGGIEEYDVAGQPTTSCIVGSTPIITKNIWHLKCTPTGFNAVRRSTQCAGGGPNQPPFGSYWASPGVGVTWVIGATGATNTGYSATYATGPNTCCYLYAARWDIKDFDGQHPPFYKKSGNEFILTCVDPSDVPAPADDEDMEMLDPGPDMALMSEDGFMLADEDGNPLMANNG